MEAEAKLPPAGSERPRGRLRTEAGRNIGGGIRWLWQWTVELFLVKKRGRPPLRSLFNSLRAVTWALALLGLVFALRTSKPTTLAVWVQVLLALSAVVFVTVGFWVLCPEASVDGEEKPAERGAESAHRVGWLLFAAGLLGGVIYVGVTYSEWAVIGHPGHHLWGGVAMAWMSDLLFLPSIAVLLPLFLIVVPDGHRHDWRWVWSVMVPSVLAAVLLYLAAASELTLVPFRNAPQPLRAADVRAPNAGWLRALPSGALEVTGLCLLALALILAFASMVTRTLHAKEPEWRQLKWYAYGGVVGLVALAPYLVLSIAPLPYSPGAALLARAWGAVVASMLPLVAIPATLHEPWPHGKLRRLFWGAAIAVAATVIHELVVITFGHRLEQRPGAATDLSSGAFWTYAGILLIAIAAEPTVEMFHWIGDRVSIRLDKPHDALDNARDILAAHNKSLERASLRAGPWIEKERRQIRANQGAVPEPRYERMRQRMWDAIEGIRQGLVRAESDLAELAGKFASSLEGPVPEVPGATATVEAGGAIEEPEAPAPPSRPSPH